MTSNVDRVYPFQVLFPADPTGLAADSEAQAEEVRAVDVERVHARIGWVPPSLMNQLDDALRLHLSL